MSEERDRFDREEPMDVREEPREEPMDVREEPMDVEDEQDRPMAMDDESEDASEDAEESTLGSRATTGAMQSPRSETFDADEERIPVGPVSSMPGTSSTEDLRAEGPGPEPTQETGLFHPTSHDGHDGHDGHVDAIWSQLAEYRRRLDELQVEFIDEPRRTVEKTESLVEEAVDHLMDGLHRRLQEIRDEAGTTDDTEVCRQAMRHYRDVMTAFGAGHP